MSVAPLTRAAADVLGICDSLGRRACLIGGIAVQRWGQPRATQDVDVTVLAPVDVSGIVRRQGHRLDVERIRCYGREFADLKEDPDLLVPFEAAWRLLR